MALRPETAVAGRMVLTIVTGLMGGGSKTRGPSCCGGGGGGVREENGGGDGVGTVRRMHRFLSYFGAIASVLWLVVWLFVGRLVPAAKLKTVDEETKKP